MSGRTVCLRVRWTGGDINGDSLRPFLDEHGLQDGSNTEFGMQRGRSEVVPGVPQTDGSILFEATVEPYRDARGRQRFRGEFVQGPPDEPFLYLSWRVTGGDFWIARGKVLLAPLADERVASAPNETAFETEISHLGHRGRGHIQEWRPV